MLPKRRRGSGWGSPPEPVAARATACSVRLVYAPFHHVVPGVAPTVQRMPTVACARACGAEHDPDSGVDCVQIAATVHDTVNSCSPDAGGELCRMYVVVTQVQAQRGHVRPGPARARPGPGVLRAEGTGRRPATTGLRTSISNPFETVKSADFRGKICVVNGGKYAFSLSGLVPNSELSGSRGKPY